MARTIAQAFLELKQNLEITGLQSNDVSNRQTYIRDVLKSGLDIYEDFLTGSYQRNTLIAPLATADIDLFVVLENSYFAKYQYDQSGLLGLVKTVLVKAYPGSSISKNGQAVTVQWRDFAVDVVPAFRRSPSGYFIPNADTRTWIETDPRQHIRIWSDANAWHKGDLVPLIKMIKYWNREHRQVFNSFHLECLILKTLNRIQIFNSSSGVRYFFEQARSLVSNITYDPAGFGGDVGAYMLNDVRKLAEAKARIELAYRYSHEAELFEFNGRTELAFARWKHVFGPYFASYY